MQSPFIVRWRAFLQATQRVAHRLASKPKAPAIFKKGIIRKFLYRKLKRFLPDASTPADKKATLALILGILGLLVIPLLGPVALYLGIAALEDGTTKRTEAIIGIILGALTTLLVIVTLLAIAIWLGWIGL